MSVNHMLRACQLAYRGEGLVEPNPMVGCVIAIGDEVLAEGWHRAYGVAHAEVDALSQVDDPSRLPQATMYVTLEPCCHRGKTPPCTEAILRSGIRHVVVAVQDPFAEVSGQGLRQLRQAGLRVEVGANATEATEVMAPYLKLLRSGRPWVIAKWAMTLDGKLATRTRHSQWISSAASRQVVHQLRGRVDAILVGRGTATADDPLLTARPLGARKAVRIVMDSNASLSRQSQLAKSASEVAVLVAVGPAAEEEDVTALQSVGVEVLRCTGTTYGSRMAELLDEMGRRRWTNVLVEGGSQILGTLRDLEAIDEVHVFVAPKIVGGAAALTPIAGDGAARIDDGWNIGNGHWEQLAGDLYFRGRIEQ